MTPSLVSRLGVAVGSFLLASAIGVESPAADAAEAESPAACSRVDYGKPRLSAKRDSGRDGLEGPPGSSVAEPPNADGPTVVGVGFFVNDIRGIDPVRDQFQFRGQVRTIWCDPRLSFDPAILGRDERILTGEQVEKEIHRMWFASGYPVNQTGNLDVSERVLRIRSDGTVEQTINASLPLATHYDLHRFPFDRQTLVLQVESYLWNRDQLQLVPDETISGFSDGIAIPEWEIRAVRGHVSEVSVIRSNIPFSRYTLEIEVHRQPGFYLWKVFLPLIVIVSLSWSVFWMTDERFPGRSRVSATGVLTIVAYQFVFAENLPRVGYLTLLDMVMIGSFGLLAVTVVESLLVDRANQHDPARALQIDRTSRWLFPTAYALMLATIALLAG